MKKNNFIRNFLIWHKFIWQSWEVCTIAHCVTEHTDVAALTISVHSYTLNGHTKNRGQNEIIKIYKNKVH